MKYLKLFYSTLLGAIVSATVSSCAGYQMGNSKPAEMHSVTSLSIPIASNDTQEQRLATLMTNSVVDAITRDGTYKVENEGTADAQLFINIERIRYSARRYNRFDSLRATEMYMYLKANWKVVDNQNLTLSKGSSEGRTQFAIEANQQTSRSNALPLATEATAALIVQRIANGFW